MNASIPTEIAYFNYIYGITLPTDVVDMCSHSGDCSEDIDRCFELPEVKAELSKIDPEQLKKELRPYGAWDDDELNDHTENLKRILWIAANNISEERTENN